MAWEAEPIKHFLEVSHIGEDGRKVSQSQEYSPGRYSTDISLNLSKSDAELRVRPYTLEHLTHLVEEDYENGIVNELFVGIRDGTDIAYVGKFWPPKQFMGKSINQYFFRNDQPSGHNFGRMSGPRWPVNHPAILDERLVQYFIALKDVRPGVIGSLDRCMEHLTRAGPRYTGTSDGSVSFIVGSRE